MAVIDLEPLSAGRRLRTLRVARGLSQWALAAQLGVPAGRLSELENERRAGSPDEWARLSEALGVDLSQPQAA